MPCDCFLVFEIGVEDQSSWTWGRFSAILGWLLCAQASNIMNFIVFDWGAMGVLLHFTYRILSLLWHICQAWFLELLFCRLNNRKAKASLLPTSSSEACTQQWTLRKRIETRWQTFPFHKQLNVIIDYKIIGFGLCWNELCSLLTWFCQPHCIFFFFRKKLSIPFIDSFSVAFESSSYPLWRKMCIHLKDKRRGLHLVRVKSRGWVICRIHVFFLGPLHFLWLS